MSLLFEKYNYSLFITVIVIILSLLLLLLLLLLLYYIYYYYYSSAKVLELKNIDYVLLLYAHGIACLETGVLEVRILHMTISSVHFLLLV